MILDKNKNLLNDFDIITREIIKRYKDDKSFLADILNKGIDNLSFMIIDGVLKSYSHKKNANLMFLSETSYVLKIYEILFWYTNNLEKVNISIK